MIADALRGAGARVLANESQRVELRGEKLNIVGIDDLWSRRAEPSRAFRGIGADECTIVLAHNPDTALYTRHLGPGVMLSGHTHGGVVRIPFYGSPIKSILRIGKRFYAGLNRYGEFYIYTNRGLGTFWVRIRINCRPEVSRFRLTPLMETGAQHEPPVEHIRKRHRRRLHA
jgi:predicted MPP superfamily phosphohydrolase